MNYYTNIFQLCNRNQIHQYIACSTVLCLYGCINVLVCGARMCLRLCVCVSEIVRVSFFSNETKYTNASLHLLLFQYTKQSTFEYFQTFCSPFSSKKGGAHLATAAVQENSSTHSTQHNDKRRASELRSRTASIYFYRYSYRRGAK